MDHHHMKNLLSRDNDVGLQARPKQAKTTLQQRHILQRGKSAL